MKHLTALFILILIGFSSYGQDIATVQIFQIDLEDWSQIMISYDDGTKENIPLKSISGVRKQEELQEIYQDNQITIAKMIKSMEDKGFELVSTSVPSLIKVQAYMVFRRKEK